VDLLVMLAFHAARANRAAEAQELAERALECEGYAPPLAISTSLIVTLGVLECYDALKRGCEDVLEVARRRGAMQELAQITDAAVIPLPDEEAGQIPKAFVVTNGSMTPEEVSQFVADHVAPYKRARAVEIIEEIPKAPSGKILRRVLIERERSLVKSG
jgi:hypothetical protein